MPKHEIKAPDEAAFHKKLVELENRIKDLYKNVDDLKDKFQDLVNQKSAQRKGTSHEPKEVRDKL